MGGGGALRLQRADHLGLRHDVHAVRHVLHAGLGLHADAGGHIRTDSLYGGWSPRTQGVVDALCYLVFFFPPLIALLYVTWDYFWVSFMRNERVVSSPSMPVVYPLKFVMPATCTLLLLQGVAEMLRSIHAARTGEWLPRPTLTPGVEKVDV